MCKAPSALSSAFRRYPPTGAWGRRVPERTCPRLRERTCPRLRTRTSFLSAFRGPDCGRGVVRDCGRVCHLCTFLCEDTEKSHPPQTALADTAKYRLQQPINVPVQPHERHAVIQLRGAYGESVLSRSACMCIGANQKNPEFDHSLRKCQQHFQLLIPNGVAWHIGILEMSCTNLFHRG